LELEKIKVLEIAMKFIFHKAAFIAFTSIATTSYADFKATKSSNQCTQELLAQTIQICTAPYNDQNNSHGGFITPEMYQCLRTAARDEGLNVGAAILQKPGSTSLIECSCPIMDGGFFPDLENCLFADGPRSDVELPVADEMPSKQFEEYEDIHNNVMLRIEMGIWD
jgi:hypothetical protein